MTKDTQVKNITRPLWATIDEIIGLRTAAAANNNNNNRHSFLHWDTNGMRRTASNMPRPTPHPTPTIPMLYESVVCRSVQVNNSHKLLILHPSHTHTHTHTHHHPHTHNSE